MILTKIVEDMFGLPYDICNIIASYMTMKIAYFPENVLSLIFEYFPYNKKYILNKSCYNLYHKYITFTLYDSYIRHIIRNDMVYIFNIAYSESKEKWKSKTKKNYRGKKQMNYMDILNQYCIEYKSNKCRQILMR